MEKHTRNRPVQQLVLSAMGSIGFPTRPVDIKSEIGKHVTPAISSQSIYNCLERLVGHGQVVRVRRGLYRLAYPDDRQVELHPRHGQPEPHEHEEECAP